MIVISEIVGGLIVLSLLDAKWSDASVVLDLVAIAVIVGTAAAYNRLRTSLTASEAAAMAWREERDAAVSARDRLTDELKSAVDTKVAMIARVTALEQRPDLTKLEGLVADSVASQLRHETQAAERTDRLIGAIQALGNRQKEAEA